MLQRYSLEFAVFSGELTPRKQDVIGIYVLQLS